MSAKTSFVVCALALFVQSVVTQCTSPAAVSAALGLGAPYGLGVVGLGYNGLAAAPVGLAYDGLAGWAGNGLAAGWAGNGLTAGWAGNGLAAGWAGNGLATGWAGNGLGCNGLGYDGLAAGWAGNGYNAGAVQALDFTPTSGGDLPVSSASAIAPAGILVLSENVYEGGLNVAGELPFVGTVAFENVFPTAGAGVVNHACGNGINAMSSGAAAYGAGWAGNGLGCNGLAYDGLAAGWAGNGLGCNGLAYDSLAAGWAGNGLGCNGLAYDGLAASWASNGLSYNAGSFQALDFTPTSGGGLLVSSASPIAPVGISVLSENVYEGGLNVAGELPYVGTVAFENLFPTAGAGVVNHACGNGINAMSSGAAAYGAGVAGIAPGVRIGNIAAPGVRYGGCGCGAGLGYVY